MKNFTLLATYVVLALCAGCALTPTTSNQANSAEASTLGVTTSPQGNCPVWIYRNKTSFHALRPVQPYVYVNGNKINTISIGQTFCLNLTPGQHQISIRESIMFIPAHTEGTITVNVKENETLYVRYSKEFGGLIPTGTGATVAANSNLVLVPKEAWEGRR